MSATLDRLLAATRSQIDQLRAESQEHAREATGIADQMAEPAEAYRAMEAEEANLLQALAILRAEMETAAHALTAMDDERKRLNREAEAAANAAEHYEGTTLPHLAALLDGVPPAEALAATGLMVEPAKEVPVDGNGRVVPPPGEIEIVAPACQTCGEPIVPDGDHWLHVGGVRDHVLVPADVDVRAETARSTGGYPVVPPPVPDEPGQVVATHRPDMTLPDTGLAPPPLEPAQDGDQPRHAKPKGSRRTGAFKIPALGLGHRDTDDEQDGDADE